MNFLSHFYHELPCDDPYFAAGLMLPDILSNYSYRAGSVVKLHPWKLAPAAASVHAALTEGVKTHYAVDEAFHPSDFFVENTHFIRGLMTDYPFECFPRRRYAIDHILLEIILDRAILNQKMDVCHQLYTLLDNVELPRVAEMLHQNGLNGHADKAAAHFGRFRQERFIYDYVNDYRLVGLIGHINQRLGNPPMTDNDKAWLKDLIYAIESSLHHQKFPKFRSDL